MAEERAFQCDCTAAGLRSLSHLRCVDDGRELLDAIHAKVGDGESPSHELCRLQLPITSLLCQGTHIIIDGTQTLWAP